MQDYKTLVGEVYSKYYNKLFSIAINLTSDEFTAKDIIHNAVFSLLKYPLKWDHSHDHILRTIVIAIKTSYAEFRRKQMRYKGERELIYYDLLAEERMKEFEFYPAFEWMKEMIPKLPRAQKAGLASMLEEMTVKEACEVFGFKKTSILNGRSEVVETLRSGKIPKGQTANKASFQADGKTEQVIKLAQLKYKDKEIAEMLGLSRANVQERRSRYLKKLKKVKDELSKN